MSFVSSKKFGKPLWSTTEGRYFNSWKEFDEYADKNELCQPIPPRGKSSGVRRFRYDKELKKVVEVNN